jgi:hypothetical protein
MTKAEKYLGNIPKAFSKSPAAIAFWLSTLPSFLTQPGLAALTSGRYASIIGAIPPWAPGLFMVLVWLVAADIARWGRFAKMLRQPLRLVVNRCDGCITRDMFGRIDRVRLGVWNSGPGTAMVDLYIDELQPVAPNRFNQRGFSQRFKIAEVNDPVNFENQTRINQNESDRAHHHFDFLSYSPASNSFTVLVRQNMAIHQGTKYIARLSVEATHCPATLVDLEIDPTTQPPMRIRPGQLRRIIRWLRLRLAGVR